MLPNPLTVLYGGLMTKTRDIEKALAARYSTEEWVCYFEVANSTGANIRRHADCVAMSIWPSRGFAIHGHEIKVSRQDFLKEMKDPSKADAVGQFCDYWWLVVPNGLVTPEEIPETWGLMVMQKNGLRIKKQAPKNPDTADITRGFMSAMLRRGRDLEKVHIQKAIEAGNAERQKQLEKDVERRTKHLKNEMEKLRDWKLKFEETFGMRLDTWDRPDKIAEKLKLAEKLDDMNSVFGLKSAAKSLLKAYEEYEEEKK